MIVVGLIDLILIEAGDVLDPMEEIARQKRFESMV